MGSWIISALIPVMKTLILQRFAPLLRPDGLLFAGHSENFYNAADLFRLRGKTVYELANGRAGTA